MPTSTTKEIEVYADTKGRVRCCGCDARITWAEIVKTSKKMCFNGDPVALRTHQTIDMRLIEVLDLSENHWATCPEREQFKKRKA